MLATNTLACWKNQYIMAIKRFERLGRIQPSCLFFGTDNDEEKKVLQHGYLVELDRGLGDGNPDIKVGFLAQILRVNLESTI
jgi:hypothetical protein